MNNKKRTDGWLMRKAFEEIGKIWTLLFGTYMNKKIHRNAGLWPYSLENIKKICRNFFFPWQLKPRVDLEYIKTRKNNFKSKTCSEGQCRPPGNKIQYRVEAKGMTDNCSNTRTGMLLMSLLISIHRDGNLMSMRTMVSGHIDINMMHNQVWFTLVQEDP